MCRNEHFFGKNHKNDVKAGCSYYKLTQSIQQSTGSVKAVISSEVSEITLQRGPLWRFSYVHVHE